MNCCLPPSRVQSLPKASGFRPARRFGFFILALAGLILLNSTGILKAADNTVTNLATNTIASIQTAGSTNGAADADLVNKVNVLDDKYHLAIGDQLSFRILEDEDDPKILPVTDSGDLEVPYVGRYPAAGKTCKQLGQELKTELEKKYYWQATVIIAVDSKPKSRGKIYLAGAIAGPGPQDISGDEVLTVSKAISRAGGLTSYADGKKVRVTRSTGNQPGQEKKIIVNVTKIIEQGKMDEDLPLEPGDLIYVPERMIRF
jgi:polysaccharide export outer membrane protein